MTIPSIARPRAERPRRTLLQERAESLLADHPYRVELRGAPRSLAWPAICAGCGAAATTRVSVPKVFRRPRATGTRTHGPVRMLVTRAEVPFCSACEARHEAEVVRPSGARVLLQYLMTPLIIPIIGSLWFGNIVVRQTLAMAPDDPNAKWGWALAGLFGFIAVWTVAVAWHSGRWHRIERQTEVTRSADFSDDVAGVFQPQRHIWAMRNREFAEAFAALNRDRAWTDEDDARAYRRSLVITVAVLVAVAVVWLYVVLGP